MLNREFSMALTEMRRQVDIFKYQSGGIVREHMELIHEIKVTNRKLEALSNDYIVFIAED